MNRVAAGDEVAGAGDRGQLAPRAVRELVERRKCVFEGPPSRRGRRHPHRWLGAAIGGGGAPGGLPLPGSEGAGPGSPPAVPPPPPGVTRPRPPPPKTRGGGPPPP